jgi:hypothetical protein
MSSRLNCSRKSSSPRGKSNLPWWSWVIIGVVSFAAIWYTVIMVIMLTVGHSVHKELKNTRKGW